MPALLLRDVQKSHGDRLILREVNLVVEPGQRVGIVGVNGSGKSTLLRIAAGLDRPDSGEVLVTPDRGLFEQTPTLPGRTVGESAALALGPLLELHASFHQIAERYAARPDPTLEAQLATLQDRIERSGGWELSARVDAILDRLRCPPKDRLLSQLSGGERRRVALARVLIAAPELLLLDEPTNHLDADTVEWLQGALAAWRGAVVLITHDRYFLDEVADRIVEIEDGTCVGYDGGYTDYLLQKAERMARLQKVEERRLKLIAREAEWANRKPSAQRKHDHARLERLEQLKNARPLLRQPIADFAFAPPERLGGSILETHGLTIKRGGRVLVQDLELSLSRGERLGIIGPNGAGKTTLINALLGRIPLTPGDRKAALRQPDAVVGEIIQGRRTKIAFFDQERRAMDPALTVWEAVGEGNDVVRIGDQDMKLYTYLDRFLFPANQHQARLGSLSGGEQARVLLAKLILQGANLLVLDEPTNDLDLVTLRVLEEALLAFDGCALVVTHDRWFLDRVATGVLAFEGEGRVVRYADFAQHRRAMLERRPAERAERAAAPPPAPPPRAERAKKRSYKEQRELDELPGRIEAAEARKATLDQRLADPALYRGPVEELKRVQQEGAALDAEIATMYARWEALEAIG